MLKKISTLSLMACSLMLAGCKSAHLDSLCEANVVRVTPELRQAFRRWVQPNGQIRDDAPIGAGQFLKDLKVNNDLIRQRCKGLGQGLK